jgi:hypothetical protein
MSAVDGYTLTPEPLLGLISEADALALVLLHLSESTR